MVPVDQGSSLVTEAPEVSPRGRTGQNSDENRYPSGLISRLKAEVALSADGRRTGWPRRSRRRLRLARVARLAVAAAQDAALSERWPGDQGQGIHFHRDRAIPEGFLELDGDQPVLGEGDVPHSINEFDRQARAPLR